MLVFFDKFGRLLVAFASFTHCFGCSADELDIMGDGLLSCGFVFRIESCCWKIWSKSTLHAFDLKSHLASGTCEDFSSLLGVVSVEVNDFGIDHLHELGLGDAAARLFVWLT